MKKTSKHKVKLHRVAAIGSAMIGGALLILGSWGLVLGLACMIASVLFTRSQEEAAIAYYCALTENQYVEAKVRRRMEE